VSEKIAALDVVYRRLREVGLGDFCLELHSNKARKMDVLDQLRQAWEAKGEVEADEWRREAQRLKSLRDELNTYVEHLHRRHRNGLSAFTAIGRILAGKDMPRLGLSWPSAEAHDVDAYIALGDLAEQLDVNATAVGDITGGPLAPVAHAEWSPHWAQSLIQAAENVGPAARDFMDAASPFRRAVGLPEAALGHRIRDGLKAMAGLLPKAAGRDWRFVLRPDARAIVESLREGVELVARHRALMAELSPPWPAHLTEAVRQGIKAVNRHREVAGQLSVTYADLGRPLDVERLNAEWAKAEASWFLPKLLGKRAVAKELAPLVPQKSEPQIAADLERLIELRTLEKEIGALAEPLSRTGVPWAGLGTRVEDLEDALRFQAAQSAIREGRAWTEDGLDSVIAGRCGPVMDADLARMREMRDLDAKIASVDLTERTAGLWRGLRTDLDVARQAMEFHAGLSAAIAQMASTAEELAAVKGPLERLLGEGNGLLEPSGPVSGAGTAYALALARFEEARDAFRRASGRSEEEFPGVAGEEPQALADTCRAIVPLANRLNAWCAWRKVRGQALAYGLAPLVAGLENGVVALGRVREAFEVDYARWWLDAVVDNDAVLRGFVSAQHENRIGAFKALDDRFNELTKAYIRVGLCTNLPDPERIQRNSGWGVLKQQMQRKRNHMPLRTLISSMPDALPNLTPCLLMSPLSIAQYLSPNTAMFDVVVFDEASQIPVWDAVGAIARGRQVVMVGDPKQLPPTSFFERSEEGADDDVDVEGDRESILDECIGANLPVRSLDWHYRSRHESLIAFSNHRYYEGRLVTFPSPVTEDRAVSFHLVRDGVYEKGGARINKPEAFALIADLVRTLKDPTFASSGQTVGVVTFNSEQQKLIEDLLDEERRKDPGLEPYFAEDALEGVFVKNLENVQGDERDVMYFSITYGPDRSGAVSMNFGPMNKSGGERRLNVAVTRARHALKVFSSLSPDQIDLSRTKSEGVRDLKHFLEFAERGPRALAEANMGSIGDFESPFEQAVAAALAERGWRLHPQIGASRFRIDLGVVDPEAPGRYLAGIECDGATYHRSATARDRDKLREQVLRGLGWEIVRIWSTDWWLDRATALDKVHGRLNALLEEARNRRQEAEARAAAEAEAQPEAETAFVDAGVRDVEDRPPHQTPAERRRAGDDLFQGQDFALSPTYARGFAEPPAPTFAAAPPTLFRECDPATAVASVDPEAFFATSYGPVLGAMIAAVVAAEGPVRDDVLARRIARAHGWVRTGRRIHDRVLNLVEGQYPMVRDGESYFVWPKGADTSMWPRFRRPAEDVSRPVDEISLPELVALVRETQALGLVGDEALTAMARTAGLQVLRRVSRERLEEAWHVAGPTTGGSGGAV
jgi:very-short-patch-repair endonuclease